MVRLTLCIISIMLVACGNMGHEAGHPASDLPNLGPNLYQIPSAPTAVDEPGSDRVWATPDLLTFFGDYESSHEVISRDVSIVNDTPHPVHITKIYIEDDGSVVSRHGSEFFNVSWDTEATVLLAPEARAQVQVDFHRSLEQRSASMVIETTHPDYPVLLIVLTGKSFLGDDGW